MSKYRNLLVFCLGLALGAGVGCTSDEAPFENEAGVPTGDKGPVPSDNPGTEPTDTTGTEPTDTSGSEPTDTTASEPTDTAGTVPIGNGPPGQAGLLTCEPQAYEAQTMVIGLAGGQIDVGNHTLQIPALALSEDVAITVEQMEGSVRSVRLSPEGLQFAIPAILTLSYTGCENTEYGKRIVYTDESLNILNWLLSLDLTSSSQVQTLLGHFSRYAVAY
jgi:hypothetical protein